MTLRKSWALSIIALAILAAGQLCLAQAVPPAGEEPVLTDTDMAEALVDLKASAPADMRANIKAVVDIGVPIVPKLAEVIGSAPNTEDEAYAFACVLVLQDLSSRPTKDGETKMLVARGATNGLIRASQSPSARIRYLAASTLGELWAPDSGRRPEAKKQEVNAALVASAYLSGPTPGIFAPAAALFKINGVTKINGKKTDHPLSIPPEKLFELVNAWQANPDSLLPPLEKQPWALLLTRAVVAPDNPEGTRARDLLSREKPLEAVAFILDRLAGASINPRQWKSLSRLLEAITGVRMGVGGAAGVRTRAIEQWRATWMQKLQATTTRKALDHCWLELEQSVSRLRTQPSVAAREQVEQWAEIAVSQRNGIDEIPENASEAASSQVFPSLEFKGKCISTLEGLRDPDVPVYTKPALLVVLHGSMKSAQDREIASTYMRDFAAYARTEKNALVLRAIGKLLTDITGAPISLTGRTDEERKSLIDGWLKKLAVDKG